MKQIPVTVPDGTQGKWSVSSFTITPEQARAQNFFYLFDDSPEMLIRPGSYKRLIHADRGVIMSNTPMEIRTNANFIKRAKGNVLINGLGLGMVLTGILTKPEVTRVTVIELDADVIALVGPHFKGERVEIIQHDCYTFQSPEGARYDAVWHDVWDTIDEDNLTLMAYLVKKYKPIADWQGCWAKSLCQKQHMELESMRCIAEMTRGPIPSHLKQQSAEAQLKGFEV